MTPAGVCTLAAFDEIYSSKFCGLKAIDFCCSVGTLPVILLKSSDINETLIAFEEVILSVVTKLFNKHTSSTRLIFLIEALQEEDAKSAEVITRSFIGRLLGGANDVS